ncbi:ABC transporter substrate-binding protein [Nocardioides sp. NPDC047086]|uniref:ABC transporter substrate-binding protein n=1 Tax=Nocardioides sp. NPDC047086 TaxID=3154810 RepID=UPI0033F3C4DC
MPELKTLTRAQGANQALISHEVEPDGWTLSFADEPVLVKGFRKMVRDDEYDVAELAVTTYLTAKEHGARFTALPIFIVRDFHHGKTQMLADGPIRTAADLAGKRVGVNRGYTVTAGVWARAALADAGLDLSSVTWVLSGDEHVATYVPPANVEPAPEGRTLEELLLAGELDAVVNAGIENDAVVSLLPESAAWDSLKETGFIPVNHLVVVRDELLQANPGLATALFQAFAEAKRRYLARLHDGLTETKQDRSFARFTEITGQVDPLPYGVEPNRAVLEKLMKNAIAQGILTRPLALEDVFAAETLGLEG